MGLDPRSILFSVTSALNDIWIQSPLSQEGDATQLSAFLLEQSDERLADDAPLRFRVYNSILPLH